MVAGEAILVPAGGQAHSVFTLNGVGLELWDRLETPASPEELASWLAERYAIAEERARADVDGFATRLMGYGLIEAVETVNGEGVGGRRCARLS